MKSLFGQLFALTLTSLLIVGPFITSNAFGQTNSPLEKLKAMAAAQGTPPDVAEAALLGAQLIRPASDPVTNLQRLDELAAKMKVPLQGVTVATEAVGIMSDYLYNVVGYANSTVLPAEVFVGLDQVIAGQQWNCVGMALLYTALGKRLGIPLQAVAGHGHVLVAYVGEGTFYVETTLGGLIEPDRNYLREYLPFPCVDPGSYLPLDERETVALCLTQMGLAMQYEDRVQLANSLYDLALEFSPDYAEALGGRAFIKAADGKTAEAIADFEAAVSNNPDFREAYAGLGNALAAQGNTTRALECYRTLVALCPDDPDPIFNLAQLLQDTGDLEGSVAAYDRYISLKPDDPLGYLRIAFPLEDLGNLQRAAEAYEIVLRLEPNHVNALANLGHIFEQLNNFDAAMDAYGQALDLNPSHPQALGGRARILGKTNRYEDALRTFRVALNYHPGESFLWIDLGHFFQDYGELRQAIGAFQQATQVAPMDTEGYYALAETLNGAGLGEDAEKVLVQAQAVEEELIRQAAIPLPVAPQESRREPFSPVEDPGDMTAPDGKAVTEGEEDSESMGEAEEGGETPVAVTPETPGTPTPVPPNLPSTKGDAPAVTVPEAAPAAPVVPGEVTPPAETEGASL